MASRLLAPYRTVGIVTGGFSPVANKLGTETFVTVPVGDAFHVYNADKLELVLVSRPIGRQITCVPRPRRRLSMRGSHACVALCIA